MAEDSPTGSGRAIDRQISPDMDIANTLRSIEAVLARSEGLYTAYKSAAAERAAMISELIRERDALQAELKRTHQRADKAEAQAREAKRQAAQSDRQLKRARDRLAKSRNRLNATALRLREASDEHERLANRRSVRLALRIAPVFAVFRGRRRTSADSGAT